MEVELCLINMQLLFELFCRTRLKKMLPHNLFLAPYKESLSVREKGTDVKGLHLTQKLIPDLIIKRRSDQKTVALFDAKYKESSSASRSDTLQLLAYSLAMALDVVGFMFPANPLLQANLEKDVTLQSPFVAGGIPYVEIPVAASICWSEKFLP